MGIRFDGGIQGIAGPSWGGLQAQPAAERLRHKGHQDHEERHKASVFLQTTDCQSWEHVLENAFSTGQKIDFVVY